VAFRANKVVLQVSVSVTGSPVTCQKWDNKAGIITKLDG
jgi:hypothetical protein